MSTPTEVTSQTLHEAHVATCVTCKEEAELAAKRFGALDNAIWEGNDWCDKAKALEANNAALRQMHALMTKDAEQSFAERDELRADRDELVEELDVVRGIAVDALERLAKLEEAMRDCLNLYDVYCLCRDEGERQCAACRGRDALKEVSDG